jgi:hypothetical protein
MRLSLFTSLLAASLISFSALAGIHQAPPNFDYDGGKAIFVDFETAHYAITYDVTQKKAWVVSEINFTLPENGHPIYDLISVPESETIDGKATTSTEVSDPDRQSKVRVLDQELTAGKHTLIVRHRLTEGVSFKRGSLASAFWMSDLTDRDYLEQYLPSSFEYDQVAMTMHVEVRDSAGKTYQLRANGKITQTNGTVFDITFPNFYTTSSVFFHLLPSNSVPSSSVIYKSIDGRDIPVEAYTKLNAPEFSARAVQVLTELEKDYGPFPHEKVIIYGTAKGTGGMEYCGATISSLSAVGHELFHSYNARGVMPAQGNSGWIDEAMSSWRDYDYVQTLTPGAATQMAGHSKWMRLTDRNAYGKGKDFLAWIAGRMNERGQSLKLFLRDYFQKNVYTTMTTELFQDSLERYSGMDLQSDFNQYIYGKRGPGASMQQAQEKDSAVPPNPFHPRLTRQQVRALLWPN